MSLTETPPAEDLPPRESEGLPLLAEGMTNKAIAHRLDISDHTVKFHVNAIMSKLSVQSRTEAVVRDINSVSFNQFIFHSKNKQRSTVYGRWSLKGV